MVAFSKTTQRHPSPGKRLTYSSIARIDGCDACPVRNFSICAALAGDGFDALRAIGLEATFHPRTALFMEGQHAKTVHIVTAGLSNLFRLLSDGRRQVVGLDRKSVV